MAVRLTISLLAISYIVYRLWGLSSSGFIGFFEKIIASDNTWYLGIAMLLLMPLNWGLESYKWKRLVRYSEKISLATAFKAVVGGITAGIFTPNRIGEFVGRVFVLKNTDPLKGLFVTLTGSISQLLTTVLTGTVAYTIFAPIYLSQLLPGNEWIVRFTILALDVASILFLFLYFNISLLSNLGRLLPQKYLLFLGDSIKVFELMPNAELAKLLGLSVCRFMVFFTQFYLALHLFGTQISLWQALMVIPVIYLVLAAVPTVALTEIGIRGSVSVFLFGLTAPAGHMPANAALAVISASTLLWIVNIALPALVGVWVVFKLKFFGR